MFSDYSLALIHEGKIIYSQDWKGLRPLVDCVQKNKGKYKDCILHDKVVGLASAKIIVYSGMIKEVHTNTCSKLAKKHLESNNIIVKADKIVEHIFMADRKTVCPGDMKAQESKSDEEFFFEIARTYGV
jgi:hypothetical protein